jgi:hypothetical protein
MVFERGEGARAYHQCHGKRIHAAQAEDCDHLRRVEAGVRKGRETTEGLTNRLEGERSLSLTKNLQQ